MLCSTFLKVLFNNTFARVLWLKDLTQAPPPFLMFLMTTLSVVSCMY